jgi:hypothetical protein
MRFYKFIWRFAEWCLNIPLLEMASERNQKMVKIESKNKTINEHLFKWFLMSNSIDRDHWLSEIDDRFFKIENLKWGKNKRFKSDEYFNLLYNRFFLNDIFSINYKSIDKIFSKIEDKYSTEFQREWNIDEFLERVGSLLKDVSNLLESGDYDKDELCQLMSKYLI